MASSLLNSLSIFSYFSISFFISSSITSSNSFCTCSCFFAISGLIFLNSDCFSMFCLRLSVIFDTFSCNFFCSESIFFICFLSSHESSFLFNNFSLKTFISFCNSLAFSIDFTKSFFILSNFFSDFSSDSFKVGILISIHFDLLDFEPFTPSLSQT